MSINIKTPSDLITLSGGKVTANSINQALGYEPANKVTLANHLTDMNNPHATTAKDIGLGDIQDQLNDRMIITDSQGNIACEIGVSGISTTQVNLKNNDNNAYGVSIVPKQNMTSDIIVSLPQNPGTLARMEDIDEALSNLEFPEGEIPDLTNYIKNTDYATDTKFGIVKATGTSGIGTNTNGLYIVQAKNNKIDAKTDQYSPITPKNLDYAIKVGVTTNTETLTGLEQDIAQNWLGGVGRYYRNSNGEIRGEIFGDYQYNVASGYGSHAEGGDEAQGGSHTVASGLCAHAEGSATQAEGAYSHAEGYNTQALGMYSHTEGFSSYVDANASSAHAESGGKVYGSYSHAEGQSTADGAYAHSEGEFSNAQSYASHAEGCATVAMGDGSHAEGKATRAEGHYSHAEGYYDMRGLKATGTAAHAEGCDTWATGQYSHAENYNTTASGTGSHAEGFDTTASGNYSHAEGYLTNAIGNNSHASGYNTTAGQANQFVCGVINNNKTTTLFEVGNGQMGGYYKISFNKNDLNIDRLTENCYYIGEQYQAADYLPLNTSTRLTLITPENYNTIENNVMDPCYYEKYNHILSNAIEIYQDGHAELPSLVNEEGQLDARAIGNSEFAIATKGYVDSVSNNVDLSDYYTRQEIDDFPAIQHITSETDGSLTITDSSDSIVRVGAQIYFSAPEGVDFDGAPVTNLPEPQGESDAATKSYVDSKFYVGAAAPANPVAGMIWITPLV